VCRISYRKRAERRISRSDRVVSPLEGTCRILTSTGSSDLIFKSLDFGRASFDLEVVSLFPDGVYEEEESSPAGCADEPFLFLESGTLPQNISERM